VKILYSTSVRRDTQRYCNYFSCCVKCREEHLSESCNKSKDSPAIANVLYVQDSGEHTANHKGYPFYKKINKNELKTFTKALSIVILDAQTKPQAPKQDHIKQKRPLIIILH